MRLEKVKIAEGVVADVLNDAAAVGVGAGLVELGRGQAGIAGEQQGNDGVMPGEVDELLVGEQRIGLRAPLPGGSSEQQQEREKRTEPGKLICLLMLV